MSILKEVRNVLDIVENNKAATASLADVFNALDYLADVVKAHDAKIQANRLHKLDKEQEENELTNTKP